MGALLFEVALTRTQFWLAAICNEMDKDTELTETAGMTHVRNVQVALKSPLCVNVWGGQLVVDLQQTISKVFQLTKANTDESSSYRVNMIMTDPGVALKTLLTSVDWRLLNMVDDDSDGYPP